jgi:hypothetical protein
MERKARRNTDIPADVRSYRTSLPRHQAARGAFRGRVCNQCRRDGDPREGESQDHHDFAHLVKLLLLGCSSVLADSQQSRSLRAQDRQKIEEVFYLERV